MASAYKRPVLSESVNGFMGRLRKGHRWLTEQHRLWLFGDTMASDDERFSQALAQWDALERVMRCFGYQGCVWGALKRCPVDAPVICDGCAAW